MEILRVVLRGVRVEAAFDYNAAALLTEGNSNPNPNPNPNPKPNLKPKPNSFSSADLQKQSDGELFWKLSTGKGMMVPYKHSLSEEKRWQLINYIRTLKVIR